MFLNFGTPIPIWILTALYIFFVTYAGPKYMKNRPAYSLKYFMVVYNIGLVFMSIYMFVEVRVLYFLYIKTCKLVVKLLSVVLSIFMPPC